MHSPVKGSDVAAGSEVNTQGTPDEDAAPQIEALTYWLDKEKEKTRELERQLNQITLDMTDLLEMVCPKCSLTFSDLRKK